MNESITRAAGSVHGQELDIAFIKHKLDELGIQLEQRNTLYGSVSNSPDTLNSRLAIPLEDISYQVDRIS